MGARTVTGFTWALMTAGFTRITARPPRLRTRKEHAGQAWHVGMMEPIVPNTHMVHVCIGRVYACVREAVLSVSGGPACNGGGGGGGDTIVLLA